MPIAILLATYNSGRRLRYQLDSLFLQNYKDWILYVHDDGSLDDTLDILAEYANRYKGKLYVMKDKEKGRGAKNSFFWLLDNVVADYYMFCDHDDIWLPNKIKLSLNALQDIEKKRNNLPICVFSDLALVDGDYNVYNASMWKSARIKPDILIRRKFLAVFNCVTGCTMLFNKAAKDVASVRYDDIPMHDWWVAYCVVKNNGVLFPIHKATILYCQHGNNVVGVRKIGWLYYKEKLFHIRHIYRRNIESVNFLSRIGELSPFDYWLKKITYCMRRI